MVHWLVSTVSIVAFQKRDCWYLKIRLRSIIFFTGFFELSIFRPSISLSIFIQCFITCDLYKLFCVLNCLLYQSLYIVPWVCMFHIMIICSAWLTTLWLTICVIDVYALFIQYVQYVCLMFYVSTSFGPYFTVLAYILDYMYSNLNENMVLHQNWGVAFFESHPLLVA